MQGILAVLSTQRLRTGMWYVLWVRYCRECYLCLGKVALTELWHMELTCARSLEPLVLLQFVLPCSVEESWSATSSL